MHRRILLSALLIGLIGCGCLFISSQADAKPSKKDLEKKYGQGYTKERFENADVNKDEKLDRGEAADAATDFEKKAGGGKRFNTADTDNDGSLTLDEAAKQKQREKNAYQKVQEPGKSAVQERIEDEYTRGYNPERFNKASGDDGILTREEAGAAAIPIEKFDKHFDVADTNGDGVVTRAEARARDRKTRNIWDRLSH